MKEFFLTLLIAIIAGLIDVLPMFKMKLDKYSIASAFVYYLVMPFIVYHVNLFNDIWYIKGGIIGLLLALPVIIMVAKDDKKSAIPMVIMSLVLGSLVGIAGHYLNLM